MGTALCNVAVRIKNFGGYILFQAKSDKTWDVSTGRITANNGGMTLFRVPGSPIPVIIKKWLYKFFIDVARSCSFS